MAWILPFVLLGSCDKELVEYEKVSVEIVVERGDAWLHDFPLFLGIKRKNPPQARTRMRKGSAPGVPAAVSMSCCISQEIMRLSTAPINTPAAASANASRFRR